MTRIESTEGGGRSSVLWTEEPSGGVAEMDGTSTSAGGVFPARQVPERPRSVVWRYGLAPALVAAALAATLLLRPLFPHPFFFFFFPAVMGAAWFGGMASGLLAVVLSTLVVDYFLVPPFYSLSITATEVAYFVAFVLCALAAIWISSLRKRREDNLVDARDRLQASVAEHTAELVRSRTELKESDRGLQLLAEVIPQQMWSGSSKPSGDSADALREVLSQVVDFAVSLVKCDSCLIYVQENDELILRASRNPHPDAVDRLKLRVGQGITGWVAEHRQPVAVTQNAAADPRFRMFHELPEDSFESFLSVPVLSRGRLVGVMNLQNRAPYQYGEREIRLLSTVGHLVGAEIEMARLEAESSRLSQKLEERKLLDRAKGILQRDLKLSEEDAYLALQSESRKRGKPMREIAASIVLNEEIRRTRN
jgi:putative methionine-R-sulfoxide reductase with GAF domain